MDAAAVSAITGAVDFSTVIVGIGAIGAALGLLYLSQTGARSLVNMIRGR